VGVGVRAAAAPKMFWRRELMKAVKRDWVLGKGASGEEEEAGLVVVVVSEAVEAGEFVRTARRSSSKSAALSTVMLVLCIGGSKEYQQRLVSVRVDGPGIRGFRLFGIGLRCLGGGTCRLDKASCRGWVV